MSDGASFSPTAASTAAATPGLVRFLTASLLGFLGGHIVNFGVVQYAQEVLGQPGLSGLALLLSFGTPIAFGLHAGVLCDRRSALRVAIDTQWSFVAGAVLLTWMAAWPVGEASVTQLLLGAFATGLAWSYVAPARLVYLGRLVAPERLRAATIIFNVLTTVGFGAAPFVLGLLRAAGGFAAAFAGAALLFLTAQVLLAGLPRPAGDPPAEAHPGSWLAAAGNGLGFVWRTPLLRDLLMLCVAVHILLGPVQVILPPLLAERLGLGVVGRGAFLGLLAPVLVLGGLIALRLKALAYPGRALAVAALAAGAALAGMALTTARPLAATAFIAFGTLGGVVVALIAALLQQHAEPARRGLVMSLYSVSTQFFPALGGLISGMLLMRLDPATALLALLGVMFVVLIGLLLTARALWALRS